MRTAPFGRVPLRRQNGTLFRRHRHHRRERLPKLEPHRHCGKRYESDAGSFEPVEAMAMIVALLVVVVMIVAVVIVRWPFCLV